MESIDNIIYVVSARYSEAFQESSYFMIFNFNSRDESPGHCVCREWALVDEDALVECVALLAVGHYHHVGKILLMLRPEQPSVAENAIDKVVGYLTVPTGQDPYNRDGWLFQLISWVALNETHSRLVSTPPHAQPAHKSFDGVGLRLNHSRSKISSVIVCEDKATDNPRGTFNDYVLPDVKEIRDHVLDADLLATVTTLVERSPMEPDAIPRLIESALWKRRLSYRVAITSSNGDMPPIVGVFDGFADAAALEPSRCSGELLLHDDFRDWLSSFAERVVEFLHGLEHEEAA